MCLEGWVKGLGTFWWSTPWKFSFKLKKMQNTSCISQWWLCNGIHIKSCPSLWKKNYICALISMSTLISLTPFSVRLICFCFLSHAFFLCPPHLSCYIIPWDDLTVYFFLITIQANNEKHMWKKTKLSCGLNGTKHSFSTQTWITLIIIKQRSLLLGNWGLVFTCLWLLHIPPS